jgi:hypothetical protein
MNTALGNYLPLTGGSLSGNLAMVGNKITGLAAGSASGDSVEYDQYTTALGLKADLASPALTGVPTTPTAAANDNSTTIASTAYVDGAVSAISLAPSIVGTQASPALQDGTVITFGGTNYKNIKFIAGDAAPITVTANPRITGGIVGQELMLISKDATNTVTLQDGNGLSLNGTWVGGLDSVLNLVYDGAKWVEASRR